MTLSASGSFAAVVNGAMQVAQALRDQFAERTNAAEAWRVAEATGGGGTGSTSVQELPWNSRSVVTYFDLTTVHPAASFFQGMIFDGRWLYWVPFGDTNSGNISPWLAAYDTTLSFTTSSSYQVVSLTVATGSPSAQGFLGAALDAQGFLYLVPQAGAYPQTSGLVVRYDTSKLLSDTTAYSTFDVTQLSSGGVSACSGYASACFDGRWVYLCPTRWGTYGGTLTDHGSAVRYDTTKAFADTHSWDYFNLATLPPVNRITGLQTIICDGRFIYYVPFGDIWMARYQIGSPFTSTASWSTLNLTTIVPISEAGLTGATQVGRYIFFTPWLRQPTLDVPSAVWDSVICRLDAAAADGFTSGAAWATFDLLTLSTSVSAQGYQGSVSDGLFVYLVPSCTGQGYPKSIPAFLRYDTRRDLNDPSAWVEISGTPNPSTSAIFSTGGASDGVYGYNCPYSAFGSGSGQVYRWRLWPGDPNTPNRDGAATSFWQDSSGYTGFGTNQPTDQIHAGTVVLPGGATAAANVRADGLLLGQIGASSQAAPAVLSATVSTAVSFNSGMSETPLVNYQLPSGAMASSTKGIRVTAYGYYANTTVPKTLNLYFGTIAIVTSVTTAAGRGWYLDASVIRQKTNQQEGGGMIVSGASLATGATQIKATESVNITVEVSAIGQANRDVVLTGFLVDFLSPTNS
jgi:hypothetical protein